MMDVIAADEQKQTMIRKCIDAHVEIQTILLLLLLLGAFTVGLIYGGIIQASREPPTKQCLEEGFMDGVRKVHYTYEHECLIRDVKDGLCGVVIAESNRLRENDNGTRYCGPPNL